MTDKVILQTRFSMDIGGSQTFSAAWNTNLQSETGKPLGKIDQRQIEEAAFALKELRDMRGVQDIRDHQTKRAEMIRHHFAECASQLIQYLEDREQLVP